MPCATLVVQGNFRTLERFYLMKRCKDCGRLIAGPAESFTVNGRSYHVWCVDVEEELVMKHVEAS